MSAPVIVPLDGSAGAERALGCAVVIARRTGAPIDLVRVATPDLGEKWVWSVRGNQGELEGARGRELALDYLTEVAQEWKCERVLLVEGTGAEEGPLGDMVDALAFSGSEVITAEAAGVSRILAQSLELDADLIAVGVPQPHVGVLRYGSLASRLLRQTPVPLLLSCAKPVAWGPSGARSRAAATPAPAA